MARFDETSRTRLKTYLIGCFDADSAGNMEAFVQNFLHNGKIWDAVAEGFPDAPASAVRTVMLEAYGEWRRQQGLEDEADDKPKAIH